jgi:hypothetical protein
MSIGPLLRFPITESSGRTAKVPHGGWLGGRTPSPTGDRSRFQMDSLHIFRGAPHETPRVQSSAARTIHVKP